MDEGLSLIQDRFKFLETLLERLENRESTSVTAILEAEISRLRQLTAEYKHRSEAKKVISKEDKVGKERYFLKDGSVYVVKQNEYKYLYDSNTKMMTYEFGNGQIERTFPNGLKEIRRTDGTVIIKTGPRDYDYVGRK